MVLVMMVGPPDAPTITTALLFLRKIVGDILDKGLLLGAMAFARVPTRPKKFGTPGRATKSSI